MVALTLLTKIGNDNQLEQVGKALDFIFKGLEVDVKILGTIADRWVQIALTGEDEEIARNYVIKEAGLCPSNFGNVNRFSTLKGYIKNIRENPRELYIDVGVYQPKIVYAKVALCHLQAKLVGGREIALRKIADLFGFCEGLPISVKVVGLDEEKNCIEAKLSSRQIRNYVSWRESLLDRLLVLGVSLSEVKSVIERAQLKRDVIDVEPFGLLEYALICKLGTNAAGLVSKLSWRLKNARFSVFSAKLVNNFLKT
jgi:hypothetical protein